MILIICQNSIVLYPAQYFLITMKLKAPTSVPSLPLFHFKMNSHKSLFLHKTHDISLNMKSPMNSKILCFKQDKEPKQALKTGLKTCSQFSFVYLRILVSHLKQLKALKYLTLDLTYLLQIPKILISLKYIKSLSVLHFELKRIIYLLEPNFHAHCHALSLINGLLNVQVCFSLENSH